MSATTTVKVTLEGQPDLVEAITKRIEQFFTVTWISKNNTRLNGSPNVRCYLRLLPPDLAHPEPPQGAPMP